MQLDREAIVPPGASPVAVPDGADPRDARRPTADEQTLREVVERLAPIDRTPCSAGEREAAEWIAERLRAAGVGEVALEDEPSWGTFLPQMTALGGLGMLAGAARRCARRRRAALGCAVAAVAGIVDEAQNGPRVLRRAVRRRRSTVNVVARAGDPEAARTLVVLAHHDAAQTGRFFDQSLMIALHRRWPELIERGRKRSCRSGGSAWPRRWRRSLTIPLGRRGAALARRGASARSASRARGRHLAQPDGAGRQRQPLRRGRDPRARGDGSRERPLPGPARAARLLRRRGDPAGRHPRVHRLPPATSSTPERTWFLNLDRVGSPHLVMLEGEGPIWMEEHTDPSLPRPGRATSPSEQRIELERGFRARASTDSIIPSRAGYPSAFIGSITDWRLPANYHLMTDVPENLDYGTIADATNLVYALARRLAGKASAA